MSPRRYPPLADHALLGNGNGAALVTREGTVNWLAVPAIDTSPLLASILDADDGGFFELRPTTEANVTRRYLEGTMVLETTFETSGGLLRVTDALTVGFGGVLPWSELVRRVEVEGGAVPVRWALRPGSRFASERPWLHQHDGHTFALCGDLLATVVVDQLGSPQVESDRVCGQAVLAPGTKAVIGLVIGNQGLLQVPQPGSLLDRLAHTIEFWRAWSSQLSYDGPHEGAVKRSALVLKSLASTRTGALAAAPTTSLPEVVDSKRNYDYRFGWVRDGSFMIDAMTRLGLSEEVDASLTWMLASVRRTAPDIHVFYTLDGSAPDGEQHTVDSWEGYQGSRPVQTGNHAAVQTQHGSYGDLFGAVSRYVARGGRLDTDTGLLLVKLADQLCDEWPRPDAGIWELGQTQRYTSSMINAWAALKRATELAANGELPDIHVERWRQTADAVHQWVDEHCWSSTKQSYTFYAGTDDLDASVLLAARTGFLAGDDPRLSSTIDAIREELGAGHGHLYRYTGASKMEHAFVACGFWLIEALAHAGRQQEATEALTEALGLANDLDLWAEEVDPETAELRGNFPLGLSHLAVIGAITALHGDNG